VSSWQQLGQLPAIPKTVADSVADSGRAARKYTTATSSQKNGVGNSPRVRTSASAAASSVKPATPAATRCVSRTFFMLQGQWEQIKKAFNAVAKSGRHMRNVKMRR